jgi:hypothetical protein
MLLVLKLLNPLRVTESTLDACITEGLALQQKNVHRVAILVYSTAVFGSSLSE